MRLDVWVLHLNTSGEQNRLAEICFRNSGQPLKGMRNLLKIEEALHD